MSTAENFRDNFPVLRELAYLNAGTEGPVPAVAVAALQSRLDSDLHRGRIGAAYFDEIRDLAARARALYARVLGAEPGSVALTGSTTEGCNTVISGLDFSPGDEILTSDQEHPGLLAPLRLAILRAGVSVKVAPFAELANAVGPRTKLIACSHVAWVGGEVADIAALRATGVPVLLDAAQALGAVPVNVTELGVDFYAGSGQKWLCGPEGSGALYVRPDRLDELEPPWPGYATISDHDDILHGPLAAGAARLDTSFPPANRSAWAVAALELFETTGWAGIHERAASLAAQLAAELVERGFDVLPRGCSTLVSWRVEDAEDQVTRLAAKGVLVRSLPGGKLLRASVGAWSNEDDLDRLLDALS
jgi:selenocysteine lyase/cysteine desulfurase